MLITTQNISLRSIEPGDLELIRKWRNDKEVNEFMDYREYIDEEAQLHWFRNLDPHNNMYFLIYDSTEPVGLVNLKNIDWSEKTAESGIFIGNAGTRNTPFPVKVTVLIMKLAFQWLQLELLYAKVSAHNKPALEMNEALGYIRDADMDPPFARFVCNAERFGSSSFQGIISNVTVQLSWQDKWVKDRISTNPDFLIQ